MVKKRKLVEGGLDVPRWGIARDSQHGVIVLPIERFEKDAEGVRRRHGH
jgi:hypothetical protein